MALLQITEPGKLLTRISANARLALTLAQLTP